MFLFLNSAAIRFTKQQKRQSNHIPETLIQIYFQLQTLFCLIKKFLIIFLLIKSFLVLWNRAFSKQK